MQLRIVDYNYAVQSTTTVSASSSDSEFPAANLQSSMRSKVWRSAGNFVITTGSNDKINFKEASGGAELTATVAAGTYTPTTLAAAIVTALEAAGADEYTVTHSSTTGKWTIASDGSYLALLWSSGTDTATSIGDALGFDTSADNTGALTYTGSTIAIHTEEWILFDLASAEDIDSFALLFDSMGGLNLSSNAVVTLQANPTSSWSAPAVSQVVSVDTTFETISHFFSTAQAYRYWRVKIVDTANADLYVEVGAVVFGEATQLTYAPGNDFVPTIEDPSDYQETPYGHRYGDLKPFRRSIELNYAALPYADIKTLETIFRRVGMGVPVLIAFDPTAVFYDKDHFLFYAFFDGPLSPAHLINGNFSHTLSFREAI